LSTLCSTENFPEQPNTPLFIAHTRELQSVAEITLQALGIVLGNYYFCWWSWYCPLDATEDSVTLRMSQKKCCLQILL